MYFTQHGRSWDSEICIQSSYGLNGPWIKSPAGTRDFLFSKTIQTDSGAHLASYSISTGVKWPAHEGDHSPPCSPKVKHKWSSTSTPRIYLHGVDRDKFTFSLYTSRFHTQNHITCKASCTCIHF